MTATENESVSTHSNTFGLWELDQNRWLIGEDRRIIYGPRCVMAAEWSRIPQPACYNVKIAEFDRFGLPTEDSISLLKTATVEA